MENQRENYLTKPEIKRLQRMTDVQDRVRNLVSKLLGDAHIKSRDFVLPIQLKFQKMALDIQKKAENLLFCYAKKSEYLDAESLQIRLNEISVAEEKLMDGLLILTARFEDRGIVKNELKEMFNHFRGICPGKYNSMDSLEKRTEELKELNLIYAVKPMNASGRMLQETWDDFHNILESKDYYAAGTLALHVGKRQELASPTRYHDNLDILINENEIEKVLEQIKRSKRYQVISNLNHKPEMAPTFIVKDNNGSLVNLYLFDRNEHNGTLCYLSYFKDGKEVRCHYEELPDILSSDAFNDKERRISINYLYALKLERNLPKDRHDMKQMDSYIYRDRMDSMLYDMMDSIIGTTGANSKMIERISKELYQSKGYKR